MGLFDAVDLPILRLTTSVVGQVPIFDHLVHAISRYDSFKGIPIMALFWFAWFRAPLGETPDRRAARQNHLIAVLAGAICAVLLSRVLQLALHLHQRPILAGLGLHFPDFIDRTSVNPWNSFPSDHSMLFFALATGLWQVDRRLGGFAYFWAAVMIDLPRLYLGLHYPSDIVAGAVLGTLAMIGFLRLPLQSLWLIVERWRGQHAAGFYMMAFLLTEQVARLFDDIRKLGYTAFGHLPME